MYTAVTGSWDFPFLFFLFLFSWTDFQSWEANQNGFSHQHWPVADHKSGVYILYTRLLLFHQNYRIYTVFF